MKKYKVISIVMAILLMLSLFIGCNTKNEPRVKDYQKYTRTFFGAFDTVISVVLYDTDEDHANEGLDYVETRMNELHDIFTRYNKVEGLNNLWEINKNGHIEPVVVPDELFDLLSDSKKWYKEYSDRTDISMGELISIWHKYQDINNDSEELKKLKSDQLLPSLEELEQSTESIGIDNIVLDSTNKSVFITNPDTIVDVGAIAKGYAVEITSEEMKKMGYQNFIISGGGDVEAVGRPMEEGRNKWGIGVQNPDILDEEPSANNIVDLLFVNDYSIVTSGDYQRFFEVDGKRYHHIIDKDTMGPVDYYRSITVAHPDAGFADFLATTIYVLEFEEGKALIDSIDGAEAMWIFPDGRVEYTDGMSAISKAHGASGNYDQK